MSPTMPMVRKRAPKTKAAPSGAVSAFVLDNFQHYNAKTLADAATAYKQHIDAGGYMMVTLAGAMSTGELGRTLAQMIRAGKVHAISCTGANLEEDVMNLIGRDAYVPLPNYRDMTPEDDQQLYDQGLNRVTDTAIPDETAMKPLSDLSLQLWQKADAMGARLFPHEFLYEILNRGLLKSHYQGDPKNSWLIAAAERQLPMVVPGWEDSTLGNAFAAFNLMGKLKHVDTVRSGIEYMMDLAGWYARTAPQHSIGFFQIGGGIAGDFPICVVPMLWEELNMEVPRWGYFAQITDADESYGGYSGAPPTEKITWGKIGPDTPNFNIHSDASIVVPLVFAMVLGL